MPIQSSPSSPKPQQKRAILLIGTPGARKTTLTLQFPGLYIIDCDMNLDGPEREVRKLVPSLDYLYDQVSLEDSKQLDPADCYDRVIRLMKATPDDRSWVSLDGLTACNEYIIRKIMKEQHLSYLEARNWSTFKTDAINLLFTKLRHLNKNVIVTAHLDEQTRNDPKNVMVKITTAFEPFIQGAIQQMLPGFFTDCWLIETAPSTANRLETTLYTTPLPLYRYLKNSVGLPSEIKNPTYSMLSKLSGGIL